MAPTTRRGPNTPVDNANPNNMTPESIQAMIDQALLRNSTNGDGRHSSHGDNRRNVQTARPCFYADFMKCQPLNFKGTEGVVDLKYVQSLKNEVDELKSEKAEFSNEYDLLLQEYLSTESVCYSSLFCSSRYSLNPVSKSTPEESVGLNDTVHNCYLEEPKKKAQIQKDKDLNTKPSVQKWFPTRKTVETCINTNDSALPLGKETCTPNTVICANSSSLSAEDLMLKARKPVKEVLIMNLLAHRLKRWSNDLIPATSYSLLHAHAQATKTYYKHQDSRIKKA
ncbi:hypothetical protein Tco_0726346 [Tanacetum coccineum]|uniref:Uncharacterized protein n=1 Tax=Tanacetum coccineum TaxID=301880 RepID=A0ABQ4YHL7_9ASTR